MTSSDDEFLMSVDAMCEAAEDASVPGVRTALVQLRPEELRRLLNMIKAAKP